MRGGDRKEVEKISKYVTELIDRHKQELKPKFSFFGIPIVKGEEYYRYEAAINAWEQCNEDLNYNYRWNLLMKIMVLLFFAFIFSYKLIGFVYFSFIVTSISSILRFSLFD
jgi:uncharacterized membrane protein